MEMMHMRRLLTKFVVLVLALSIPSLLKAQNVASMTGVVTDTTGAIIPGADVTLVNTTTNTTYHATTNSSGSYTLTNVTPGPGYKATFSLKGFEPLIIADIYLTVATTRTQNASLHAGGEAVTVEVSAANSEVTINTTDASVGNNFDAKMLNELPVQTRDSPAALFTLQPGVTLDGAVTGARVDQNNVTVDGLDVNDFATGNAFYIVGNAPVDSVQEFRGTVAGDPATGGPGGGGQFQLVTKSGTNSFHGVLYEYHRNTSTVANDWFNNNAGVGRAPLIRNQFGGTIGGPVLHDKLFFFFQYNNSRIVQSEQVNRTVPLDSLRNSTVSYIKDTDGAGNTCTGSSRQNTTPQCIGTLSSAQVAALDPLGIGFNSDIVNLMNQRFPHANDLTRGDGINTGGFRFNTPTPDFSTGYVGKVDYDLTSKQRIYGTFALTRENSVQSPVQFPGDPLTSPFIDRSYRFSFGHSWTISSKKVNQFFIGETVSDLAFPNTYNPQGINPITFGDGTTTLLSDAWTSPVNAQERRVPIPVVGDDFTWIKGSHNIQFGGTFKWILSHSHTVLDYNTATIGLGGQTLGLAPSLRPADIRTAGTTASNTYDSAFAFALGRVGAINSNFNNDAKGNPIAQGTGDNRDYRYFQTQLYLGDTWKVNPSLTLSYGVNYQIFSVPYEVNGLESTQPLTFDQYFSARVKQSAAGATGDAAVPLITYVLGGKANNGPGLYQPSWKDIAPRVAFAFNPSWDRRTVFNGGAGLVYDRTIVNAVQYQQDQSSYLFQKPVPTSNGIPGDPVTSLATDPRLGANNSFPGTPIPAANRPPYQPFVSNGSPFGLQNGQAFNTIIDPSLKTPYSIGLNAGIQHEFPGQFVMKVSYVGRMGRRLLGQADANQIIDFADPTSNQLLSNAFGNMTTQLRGGANSANLPAQPWFENLVAPGIGVANGYPNNTSFLADNLGGIPANGDFADFVQAISSLIPSNVGMASQFSENTFYTNKGFSTYHGLLTTLQKNVSHGLQFDVNYTWAHSIDNVSLIANQGASGGYGFICDVLQPRNCRGNSDFDVTHYISGTFNYNLPFGHGRAFAANTPYLLNLFIGGWDVSGITQWHSGQAYTTFSNAFVAGYSNDAPAIFNGTRADIKSRPHKTADGSVNLFDDPVRAQAAFSGPVGFKIGSRNLLRGPKYFNQNLGLAKNFPIVPEKLNLKFRADAFNVLNHPNFALPALTTPSENFDITGGTFGQLTAIDSGNPDPLDQKNGNGARVMQFSLRLEF
jgi:Carboxypeptidase regulatory-like domain